MENDGTTPSREGIRKRRARRRQRLHLWRQRWTLRQQRPHRPLGTQPRPLWQEPVRGALYAAGGGLITVLLPYVQHWL